MTYHYSFIKQNIHYRDWGYTIEQRLKKTMPFFELVFACLAKNGTNGTMV
jgi:hypothetical protein